MLVETTGNAANACVASPITSRLNDPRLGGNHVGAKARWAYKTYGLFRSARYPPYKLAFHSPFQEALVLTAAGYLTWVAGRQVKQATGKSLLAQFRDMTSLWFGQMIDPPSYYAQELFRADRFAKTSQFLTRFETKNGILRSINEFRPSPFATDEMSDKVLFARCCAEHKIPHVQTLAIVNQENVTWNIDPTQLRFDIFCKRQRGKGAIGAEAFRFFAPNQFRDRSGRIHTLEQLIPYLRQGSAGKSILIQRWLQNHVAIRDLAHDSLITFRVVTCMNERDDIEVTDAMLRVLADLEPRWKPAAIDGEFAAPIDIATGRLGLLTGDNMRTCCKRYRNHPITNAKVNDRVIEQWPAIAAMAKRCHAAFPHRLMIGWDIALTPHGPIMLEGNTKFDVMFLQRVQNKPAGETRLGQLLAFHLQKLVPQQSHLMRTFTVAKPISASVANAAPAKNVA
jgi:hypothetical protein